MDSQNENSKNASCCSTSSACCSFVGIDWAGMLTNSIEILKDPNGFWEKKKDCLLSTTDIYKKYLLGAALISALVNFINSSIIGSSAFGMKVRNPFFGGLVHSIALYALSLLGIYIGACVVEWLAPKFNARTTRVQALNIIAFTFLPGALASVLTMLPFLSLVSLAVGIYGLYIAYLGFGIVGGVSEEKKLVFTASSFVVTAIANMLIHMAVFTIVPSGSGVMVGDASKVSVDMDKMPKQIQSLGKALENSELPGAIEKFSKELEKSK
ncbi:MAG: YIP1 family protein [Deltaproteobacteria bacterium]|nr:YIP1 family protein [Deltaproteobacteria bacterium]